MREYIDVSSKRMNAQISLIDAVYTDFRSNFNNRMTSRCGNSRDLTSRTALVRQSKYLRDLLHALEKDLSKWESKTQKEKESE